MSQLVTYYTAHALTSRKYIISFFRKEMEIVYYKDLYYVFIFICKVDDNNEKFICTPIIEL